MQQDISVECRKCDRAGQLVKLVVSGVMRDCRLEQHAGRSTVIESLDGLCADFPSGARVRVKFERVL
jgi:hypothetical protein